MEESKVRDQLENALNPAAGGSTTLTTGLEESVSPELDSLALKPGDPVRLELGRAVQALAAISSETVKIWQQKHIPSGSAETVPGGIFSRQADEEAASTELQEPLPPLSAIRLGDPPVHLILLGPHDQAAFPVASRAGDGQPFVFGSHEHITCTCLLGKGVGAKGQEVLLQWHVYRRSPHAFMDGYRQRRPELWSEDEDPKRYRPEKAVNQLLAEVPRWLAEQGEPLHDIELLISPQTDVADKMDPVALQKAWQSSGVKSVLVVPRAMGERWPTGVYTSSVASEKGIGLFIEATAFQRAAGPSLEARERALETDLQALDRAAERFHVIPWGFPTGKLPPLQIPAELPNVPATAPSSGLEEGVRTLAIAGDPAETTHLETFLRERHPGLKIIRTGVTEYDALEIGRQGADAVVLVTSRSNDTSLEKMRERFETLLFSLPRDLPIVVLSHYSSIDEAAQGVFDKTGRNIVAVEGRFPGYIPVDEARAEEFSRNIDRLLVTLDEAVIGRSAAGVEETIKSSLEIYGQPLGGPAWLEPSDLRSPESGGKRPISDEVLFKAIGRLPDVLRDHYISDSSDSGLAYYRYKVSPRSVLPGEQGFTVAQYLALKVSEQSTGRSLVISEIQLPDIPRGSPVSLKDLWDTQFLPSEYFGMMKKAGIPVDRDIGPIVGRFSDKETVIRQKRESLPFVISGEMVILHEVGGILWTALLPADLKDRWRQLYPFKSNPEEGPIYLRSRISASAHASQKKNLEKEFYEDAFSDKFSVFLLEQTTPVLAEVGWVLRPEERAYFNDVIAYFEDKVACGFKVHEIEPTPTAGLEESRKEPQREFLRRAGWAVAPAAVRFFAGLFENGNPNQMVNDPDLGARLNIENGRKVTWVVNVDPAFVRTPNRILVQPGVKIPRQWQGISAEILPRDITAAQIKLEAIDADSADIALLDYSVVESQEINAWDELLRSREVAGLALSDDILNSVNMLMSSELAALLGAARMAGGLTVPVGIEIHVRNSEEKQLLLAA
jgi:hypothetical protein